MPSRPRNICNDCGYKWYPRGRNTSRRCPNCGVVFTYWEYEDGTRESDRRRTGPLKALSLAALGGCFGLVALVAVCAGLAGFVKVPKPEGPQKTDEPPVVAQGGQPGNRDEFEAIIDEFRADARAAERKYKGRTVTVNGVVVGADWADKKSMGPHAVLTVGSDKNVVATFYGRTQVDDVLALKKGQRAQVRGILLNGSHNRDDDSVYIAVDRCELISPLAGSTKKEPDPIALLPAAPPPRRVANAATENYTSAWSRRGAVEVRVAGVALARPVLIDAKGYEHVGPDPVCLVRVQTRRLTDGPRDLRRWVGGLASAAKAVVERREIEPLRFSGAALAGQIEGRVRLLPGGPAADDVIALPVSVVSANSLALVLSGSHVGEGGEFVLIVEADAWKK